MEQVITLQFGQTNVRDTGSHTRLRGSWLTLGRVVWMVVTFLSLGIYLIALPQFAAQLKGTSDTLAMPASLVLTSGEARILNDLGISLHTYSLYFSILLFLVALTYTLMGVIIFYRKSDDWVAIFVSLFMIISGTSTGAPPIVTSALVAAKSGWYIPVTVLSVANGANLLLFLYIFPDGKFVPRWTRWTAAAWISWILVPIFFRESPLNLLEWHPFALLVTEMVVYNTGVYALIYRYRYVATPVQRQQTKWMLLGIVVGIVGPTIIPAVIALLYPSVYHPGSARLLYLVIYYTIFEISISVWVFTVFFSILRYHLWDVDLVINRSLVYGGLTAFLGAVFLGSLLLMQQALQTLTGEMQSPVVLGASALLIGSLFYPTRRRLQHLVNHRLYHLAIDFSDVKSRSREITNPGALSGMQLGVYDILDPIGRGGMSEVYKGYQPGLERFVAVKVLPRDMAVEDEFRLRFEREAKTVATLHHPSIVNVFDFGSMDGLYYMVMDYIEGQDLRHLLKMQGRLPLNTVQSIVYDLASALDYAHAHGLIHRDVKPSNVMLHESTGQVILMDFGIAKICSQDGLTRTDGIIGTLDYVSPEQINSSREIDHRADIYGLGVMVFQMLTGEVPFNEQSAPQVMFGHLFKPAPDPRELVPDLPEYVAVAVLRALAKQPDDRFQSAGDFAKALMG